MAVAVWKEVGGKEGEKRKGGKEERGEEREGGREGGSGGERGGGERQGKASGRYEEARWYAYIGSSWLGAVRQHERPA
jgi:hypothetical protein